MAFVTLEDLKGSVDVTVFSSIFERSAQLLRGQVPILLKGKLERAEDTVKILAAEIVSLSQGKEMFTKSIHFRLAIPELNNDKLNRLKEILQLNKGNCRSYLHLIIPNQSETIISLPDDLMVNPSDFLIEQVQEIFGSNTIYLQ